jgi:2-polyprenyl-3-methyl-5-hydroxy-6-metoxy-1,4-benzoquinol methylase
MNKEINKILSYSYWRQSIELGDNYSTPGKVNKDLWRLLKFPTDLKGKSFLDIGANDGLFSFMAEKKGASIIVASDLYNNSIDSMENGWSSYGIEMLKDYFNSNILIHKNGIYNLGELNQKFDVVLVNHVINWLEDIELAIKNLALVTSGTVYISDGFLLNTNLNDRIVPLDMPIRHLYKPTYISDLLLKNGFRIDEITEINYQSIFINHYINYPYIQIPLNTKVFVTPNKNSDFKLTQSSKKISYSKVNGFYYIEQLGWVDENEVSISYNKPSIFFKVAKMIGLLNLYYLFLNNKFKNKNDYSYFVIKATKVS